MAFDDDRELNDGFDADLSDDDGDSKVVKPKKVNRKEFRQAKRKTAKKADDASKPKKNLFNRRSGKSDDKHDENGDGEIPVFTDRGIGSDDGNPADSTHSEFGYLFAPHRDDESDDDVYPDSSIYSDSDAAKNMLGGLNYDGTKDGASGSFDKFFNAPQETRPSSQFTFNTSDSSQPGGFSSAVSGAEQMKPSPIALDGTAGGTDKPDSYLPDLRPDSVFISQDDRMPTPTAADTKHLQTTPEPITAPGAEPHYSPAETAGTDEQPPSEAVTQEFLPYGSMYPSYPMNTMSPMMPYPMIIPSGGQNQGNASYQTIPIPYPMPMPMPMPMYNQYPQYMAQPMILPQYVIQQPQPQVQPQSQPQPQPPASRPPRVIYRDDYDDRYDDRYYDDRDERYDYEDRRSSRARRRGEREYDRRDRDYRDARDMRDTRDARDYREPRDYRYDDRDNGYDDGYNERMAARYQDVRRGRYERRSERYYDRIDARSYREDRPAERKVYAKPAYDASFASPEPIRADALTVPSSPTVNPQPQPEKQPLFTTPAPDTVKSGFDLAFESPADSGFGMNAFGSDVFDPNGGFSGGNTGGTGSSGSTFYRH